MGTQGGYDESRRLWNSVSIHRNHFWNPRVKPGHKHHPVVLCNEGKILEKGSHGESPDGKGSRQKHQGNKCFYCSFMGFEVYLRWGNDQKGHLKRRNTATTSLLLKIQMLLKDMSPKANRSINISRETPIDKQSLSSPQMPPVVDNQTNGLKSSKIAPGFATDTKPILGTFLFGNRRQRCKSSSNTKHNVINFSSSTDSARPVLAEINF